SPGGSTIITTVLQNFLNVTQHGMNIQEAIAAPRHHSQWLPDTIAHEPRAFTRDTRQKLQALGHTLTQRNSIGQANAIHITPTQILAAPDPRSSNAAIGH
ncbi:MAG: gamma-glutamyltransferase, partial [Candidatus Hydrogenedentota bacterium]